MVIKSLTVTENAYLALKKLKQSEESFSEVILRLTSERVPDMDRGFGLLKRTKKEAEEWRKEIKERRRDVDVAFKNRVKRWEALRDST